MNRRRLIFSMRNQDGGGHVDRELDDAAYIEFSRGDPKWSLDNGTSVTPFSPRPHLPTVRHIAFELEKTLVDAGIAAPL